MPRITSGLPWLGAIVGLAIGLGACPSGRAENPLLRGVESPSESVKEGCQIAQKKCTRCHTIERLLVTSPSDPHGWRRYVRRMRLMPSASIETTEEPKIVKCLVFRDFGIKGLATLEGETP